MKKVIFCALAALSALALSLPVAAQEVVDVEEERELDLDVDISVHAGYQGSFLKDFTAYPGATRSLHSGVRVGVDADFEVYEYEGFEFGSARESTSPRRVSATRTMPTRHYPTTSITPISP